MDHDDMRRLIRRHSFLLTALLAGALCAAPPFAAAEFRPQGTAAPGSVPGGFSFQGQLLQNGIPVTSQSKWGFNFRIWDSEVGGNQIGPTMLTAADVESGLFSVSVPVTTSTLVGGPALWLEVEINQPGQIPGSVPPMAPRRPFFSMPYALVAKAVEGVLDISTGALNFTTGPSDGDTAFFISSGTAFIGIGTSHPYSLLTMSSGTLSIDGAGARLHLSSGPMAIDGAGAGLDVRGGAVFGSNLGPRASFDAAGTLHLVGPLMPLSGGTGRDLVASPAARGDIPYLSAVGPISLLSIGAAGKTVQSDGTVPGWSAVTYPAGPMAQRGPLYGSGVDLVEPLGIGISSAILRSDGTVPAWSAVRYSSSVNQGDLLYGFAADSVTALGIGISSAVLRSDGTLPVWSNVRYSSSVAQGDILYGVAVDSVAVLGKSAAATRYLANTGGSNSPAWDRVGLTDGVQDELLPANGGTGDDLSGAAAQGSLPFFSAAGVMTTLAPAAAGQVLTTNGGGFDPTWTDLATAGHTGVANNLSGGDWGDVPFQSGISATSMLSAAGATAGQLLRTAGAGADPSWTTAVYPDTTTANWILYSDIDDRVTGLATQNHRLLMTDGSGVPSFGADLPSGLTIGGGYIYRDGGLVIGLSAGGTGTDISGEAQGSLIYKAAGILAGSGALTGVLRGDAASSGAPRAMTGTPGYNAYWVTASTIAAEQYVAAARGGTGTDLSAVATNELITMTAGGILGGAGVMPAGVLKGNGALVPTAMTGTLGYNTYWSDANTIAAEQYTATSRGGTGADLAGLTTNELIYKTAGALGGTGVMPAGVLKGNGVGVPTAMTGTLGYNTYWSDANTIAAEQYTATSRGGTGTNLAGLTTNELIYKTAGALGGTGVMPAGVLKGNGIGVPTAMTGTADYNAYWSDASTIAAEQYRPITRGGTGANISASAIGSIIYKDAAGTMAGTGQLTGVLKGNTAGTPTAMTGTAGYNAYWSDANTIAAEQYLPITKGGTGATISAAAIGSIIYKDAAGTMAGTGQLTGVLKGNTAGAPTAMTGTTGYNAYWSNANTIAAEQYVPITKGGTGATISAAAVGSIIYKNAAATMAGTGQINGVIKGNGAGAPSAATYADIGDGATYKRYAPASVAITGGRIGTATVLRLRNRTLVQLQGMTPTAKGQMYFCSDCGVGKIAVSNDTTLGAFVDMTGGAL
jgi:hypothetical protein